MKQLIYIFLISLFFLAGCTEQPSAPQQGASIRFAFGDGTTNHPLWLSLSQTDTSLAKSLALESIDEVRVMILDFSAYDSSWQYFASQDFAEYEIARDNWTGDLDKWGEWQKLLGDYFRVVADQSLNIEGSQAKGTVSGVIGLNYIFLMLLENGERHVVYENEVRAIEGETVTVMMGG